ncbi:MAG: hypothetical protein ABI416_08745 [Ginsengibacter sp.]
MKKELIKAAAGATILATYYLLRKKYANRNKYLQIKNRPDRGKHHLTQVFVKAKKHAMN